MTYYALFRRTLFLVSMVEVHTVDRSALRIMGGREALQDEFPYVVKQDVVPVNTSASREPRSITFCTASVLSLTWTLTAAQCIQFLDKYSLRHPGVEHKHVIRTEPNGAIFDILNMYKHPAFKGIIINDLILVENDIGMLKTEPIVLQQYAKVSAIDFAAVQGQAVRALGYGVSVIITKFKLKQHPQPLRSLKVLDLIVVQCPSLFHVYPAICVAKRCGHNPTICAGDSGGPLIHPSGIIAITSVSEPGDCNVEDKARSNTIGIFTAISPYLTWITSHVLNDC